MRVYQRDIVEVNFLFPDGKMKPHMAEAAFNEIVEKIKETIF